MYLFIKIFSVIKSLNIFQSLLSILERTKDYQTPDIQIDSHRHKRTSKLFSSIDGSVTASPGRYVLCF